MSRVYVIKNKRGRIGVDTTTASEIHRDLPARQRALFERAERVAVDMEAMRIQYVDARDRIIGEFDYRGPAIDKSAAVQSAAVLGKDLSDLLAGSAGASAKAIDTMTMGQDGEPDPVNHPAHYGGASDPYEAIKVIEAWGASFNIGSALKYLCRAGKKGARLEDLRKARFYIAREIELLEGKRPAEEARVAFRDREDVERVAGAMGLAMGLTGGTPLGALLDAIAAGDQAGVRTLIAASKDQAKAKKGARR